MSANYPLWKQKIDAQLEAEERAHVSEREVEALKENAEYAKNLAEHQAKFKCHIRGCTVASAGPVHENLSTRLETFPETVEWMSPTGLKECKKCHKWTCREHLHQGICMECAEKM